MAFALITTTAAHAGTSGFTTTDLNLRTGPDIDFPVIDVIPEGDDVYVEGCLRDESWCDVSWYDYRGWVYSEYLAFDYRGDYVLLPDLGLSVFDIPVISFTTHRYWNRHYVGWPWYEDRYRWFRHKVRPRFGWYAPPRGRRAHGWWRKNYRAPRGLRAPSLRKWRRPGVQARRRMRLERREIRRDRERRIERWQDRRELRRQRPNRIERRSRRNERQIERRQERRELRRQRANRVERRSRRSERQIERRQERRALQGDRRNQRIERRTRRIEQRQNRRIERRQQRIERRNRGAAQRNVQRRQINRAPAAIQQRQRTVNRGAANRRGNGRGQRGNGRRLRQ